jgi:TRAP-type C4-dicarboxylate transport system substrate-binding protein
MLYSFFLLLIAFTSFNPASLNAAEYSFKLSHFLPATSITHAKFLEPWVKRIKEQSKGRIDIKIFHSMQLGGSPNGLMRQLKAGGVDFAWTLVGYTPGKFPKTEVFELPFMARTAKGTNLALSEFYKRHLADEFKDYKVVLLHVHAPGALHLAKQKVTKLDDLRGLRIRTPNRTISTFLEHYGAAPVGMPANQVYESMAHGVIDGALLPFEVAGALKIHEQAKNHMVSRLYTTVFIFAMNKESYEKLPKDLQQIIDDNSHEHIAAEVGTLWDETEKKAQQEVENLRDSVVVKLSQNEEELWKSGVSSCTEEWLKSMKEKNIDGQTLLKDAQALIKQFERA